MLVLRRKSVFEPTGKIGLGETLQTSGEGADDRFLLARVLALLLGRAFALGLVAAAFGVATLGLLGRLGLQPRLLDRSFAQDSDGT